MYRAPAGVVLPVLWSAWRWTTEPLRTPSAPLRAPPAYTLTGLPMPPTQMTYKLPIKFEPSASVTTHFDSKLHQPSSSWIKRLRTLIFIITRFMHAKGRIFHRVKRILSYLLSKSYATILLKYVHQVFNCSMIGCFKYIV